jgi:hypothetical protein
VKAPDADARRAVICFWEGYLGIAPSLVGAAEELARAGYAVTILMREGASTYPAPPPLSAGVTVRMLPTRSRSRLVARLPRVGSYLARQVSVLVDLARMLRAARELGRTKVPQLVVGVDTFGFTVASAIPRATRVYWSLELRVGGFVRNPIERLLMALERRLIRRAALVVVQDRERARFLTVPEDRVALVPNAPSGMSPVCSSRFLHRRLELDASTNVVLHAGMIGPGTMALELARAAARMDDDFVLVFHERRRRSAADPYLRAIAEAGGKRVRLSLEPVRLDELDEVYASAYAGLVVYSDRLGPNFSEIAFASGKLGYLLRNRVPIVVNSLPSLARFVEQTGCGIAVDSLDELPRALAELRNGYDGFQDRAEEAFRTQLDFGVAFRRAFADFV